MSSELSFGIKDAKRLSRVGKPGRFSMGVGFEDPPRAKLPNVPMLPSRPQGDAGPLPNALPAVLLRIKPPNGKLLLVSSTRSSWLSFDSLNLRVKKGDCSSLENRLAPGDANDIESLVCCRRVLGLLDAGEESPNGAEPCEKDVLRPFNPPWALGSLFEFCGGGFIGELTSPENSYLRSVR